MSHGKEARRSGPASLGKIPGLDCGFASLDAPSKILPFGARVEFLCGHFLAYAPTLQQPGRAPAHENLVSSDANFKGARRKAKCTCDDPVVLFNQAIS